MQKKKKNRKLSRETDQRKALLRSLAEALFLHEKIKTTEAKAKESLMLVEKLITIAKKNNLQARRQLARYFGRKLVKKIVDEIGQRYKDRNGGYARITKLGPRKSDSARMAILELIK